MLHPSPKQLLILLRNAVGGVVFAICIGSTQFADASCGDYLAGHGIGLSDHRPAVYRLGLTTGEKGSLNDQPMVPQRSSCSNGQCRQNSQVPLSETPRVVTKNQQTLICEFSGFNELQLSVLWCRPISDRVSPGPYLELVCPPPEAI
jgi:hypothetical protein